MSYSIPVRLGRDGNGLCRDTHTHKHRADHRARIGRTDN